MRSSSARRNRSNGTIRSRASSRLASFPLTFRRPNTTHTIICRRTLSFALVRRNSGDRSLSALIDTSKQATGTRGVRVEIDQVGKVFGVGTAAPFEALRPLSIDIQPGEFVSVVGPSGCGKSTLLLLFAAPHNARCRLKQAGDHQQQRALAAAAGTDNRDKFAGLNINAERAKRLERSSS